MQVICNGTQTELADNCTLHAYMQQEGFADKPGIAVAVNETVIPKSEWPGTILSANDTILIIKATQGG